MPGRRPTKPSQLRVALGNSVSSFSETLPPTCDEVRSTSGESPVTVTVSSRVPTSSTTSSVIVLPTSRSTFSRVYFLKPGSSASTRYEPGTMLVTK
jgi:hypothetical protein